MDDLEKKTTNNDAMYVLVSKKMALLILISNIFLLFVWVVLCLSLENRYSFILGNIGNVLCALASFDILFLGYKVSRNFRFNNKTDFYRDRYFIWLLNHEMKPKLNEYINRRDEIMDAIKNLTNDVDPNSKTSKYFEAVFSIQNSKDKIFEKAWNNFNYYSYCNDISGLSNREQEHYDKVRFYVYIRVFEYNTNNNG